jgi:hypothetical protein
MDGNIMSLGMSREVKAQARACEVRMRLNRIQLDEFATFLRDVIAASTGVRLSTRQLELIGENGKVYLPSREELERIQTSDAPVYFVALVSATPINIP